MPLRSRASLLAVVFLLLSVACGGQETSQAESDSESTSRSTTDTTGATDPATSEPAAAGEDATYRAGANLCLSGAAGELGQQMQAGMELAVSNLDPDKPYGLEVVYADSMADPNAGVTVFNDLVRQDVPIVFTCGTTVLTATAPLAERNSVLLLNTSAGGPELAGLSPWLWNAFINTQLEAIAMADYMYNELGYRRVAINLRNDAYGVQTAEAFTPYWESLGGEVVEVVEHELNAPSQEQQVARLAAISPPPDTIYLMTAGADAGTFIREARQAGIEAPIVGINGVESQAVLDIAGEAANGVVYTAAGFNLESDDPITQQFVESFEAEFGDTEVPNTFLVSYYQGVLVWSQLIDHILDQGGEVTAESLRDGLTEVESFQGIGGSEIVFEENGTAVLPVAIKEISDGSFELIEIVETE